ncbi:MAG TPA: CocE/NonD family hydrolase [Acidimicrobiales bacterium]|nr:CocE/NonD family hydrolase [Acidimicrobiales bacterium]
METTTTSADQAAPDTPWRRPGRARYALVRLRGIAKVPVTVTEPEPGSVITDHDAPVTTRDGTVLRVNAYRPPGDGPFPVLLCAHPYGKDRLPKRTRRGRYQLSFQYRVLRQTSPMTYSSLTTWEAPDPAWWVQQGYALVTCDLRGAGTSEGTGSLLSRQEGEDIADLVEWAGAQPWSTGAVGMVGVSYLALSQWNGAAQRPPSLKAIAPWEGFTDPYRGLLRPGGYPEVGFLRLWAQGMKQTRQSYSLLDACLDRPLVDDWWRDHTPDLAAIDVPALVCGSFSDNNLHSRGSVDGFERISSAERHLYTHREGKWCAFYRDDAKAAQLQFFDRHLKGADVPVLPVVRLEVRESAGQITEVRAEEEWPLARTEWTPLFLGADGLTTSAPDEAGSIRFAIRDGGVRFGLTFADDVELTGPMALRLHVSVDGTDDVDLCVGVEKWQGDRFVPFEGSYGYGRDRVTTGWLSASLRALDEDRSRPFQPVPRFAHRDPLHPGEVVPVDIALGASSTQFRRGDRLRLVVAGRWLSPRNPLFGQFPANYRTTKRGTCTLHWGPDHDAHLLAPVIPPR